MSTPADGITEKRPVVLFSGYSDQFTLSEKAKYLMTDMLQSAYILGQKTVLLSPSDLDNPTTIPRDHPLLVAVVKTLGNEALSEESKKAGAVLSIEEIDRSKRLYWIITNHETQTEMLFDHCPEDHELDIEFTGRTPGISGGKYFVNYGRFPQKDWDEAATAGLAKMEQAETEALFKKEGFLGVFKAKGLKAAYDVSEYKARLEEMCRQKQEGEKSPPASTPYKK